ncbi:FRIGIDA-like protein 3 [Silene latifolia]|uniref:FRIGIDA-like protein 3 n=1 Tax=Silene latifolia TaxID=37657 RepID=UPI003D76C58F
MTDTEKMVEMNLASSVESTSALIDQLGTAFAELKARKIAASDNVQWEDIEGYFRNLESVIKEKLKELDAKEKDYSERETRNNMLLAEREAAVVAKEQDLLDKVQELKDVAVDAISEARTVYVPETLEAPSGNLTNGNKVSSSIDDENTELDAQEGESPDTGEENVEDLAAEANPRAELIQLCEQMDSKGILNFLMENLKTPSRVRKETSVALGSATEPTSFVLNALEGFFPPSETTQEGEKDNAALDGMRQKDNAALDGMRRSCLILMEALSAFLSKADTAVDTFVTPHAKWQAKCIAYEWKPKLDGGSIDAANEMSLVTEGFLRLLATFRIASDFNEDDLCKYVLAVSDHRQATELCRSLELAQKIPGLVEKLLNSGRQIDAVHFIHAFQLSGTVPSVPILRTYLKDIRRNSQGNGSAGLQIDYNARELEAIKAVIGCVEEYKLEAEYPLHQLYIRLSQLDKSRKDNRKRPGDTSKQPHQQHKRPRPDGRFQSQRGRAPGRGFGGGRRGPPQARGGATYAGFPQRYTPAAPTAYTYPVPTQSPYGAPVNDPRMYYYAQDDPARNSYSAVPPTYGTYQQPPPPSHQPYM